MPNKNLYDDGKPYLSASCHYKSIYGRKVYKLSLTASVTCPTRDGTLDNRGCIFCSRYGSGDFSQEKTKSIKEQIISAKRLISTKYSEDSYIAYFQAYTNTYADTSYLRSIWEEAIAEEGIVALDIATRPDCLGEDILSLLAEFAKKIPVTVELGLQTSKEESIRYIRRHYNNQVYEEAVKKLHDIGIHVITHMIIGLPGESKEDMLRTADFIASSGSDGIKLQLLHVLKGTDLCDEYEEKPFSLPSLEEYTDIVISIIERLPRHMVIYRITGDGNKADLIAPMWSTDKKRVLNNIHKEFKNRNTYQGKEYHGL